MRKLFPFLIIILAIYVYSCANPGSPTGGPKDTIPPSLVKSIPENQTTNYRGKEFRFEFDERIDASKLKRQLIITPIIENNFKMRVKKNQLFMEFEKDFEDSTTYTFNFADGVVDVTEKNPVPNFSIAFSTGPHLDSISISGQIKELYTDKKSKKATVALYNVNDTLDILTGKPRYFAQTDTSGFYQINNIKNGYYRIYAFEDANNNLTCQPDEEAHGFLKDSIDLTHNQEAVDIRIQLLNIKELELVRSKKTGQYFDVLYSKEIISYDIQKLNPEHKLPIPPNNLIKGKSTLRFYYDQRFRYDLDSIPLLIQTTDSVYNSIEDTVYVQFSESKRKPETLNTSLNPKDKTQIEEQFQMKMSFTKPITQYYLDSMTYQFDTLYKYTIVDSVITWNDNLTEFTINNELDKNWFQIQIDSIMNTLVDTSLLSQDSLEIDSVTAVKIKYLENIKTDQTYFNFRAGSFISIDQDTVEQITRIYTFKNPENYGTISGTVNTSRENYTLELIDNQFKVHDQIKNATKYQFRNVRPGKYSFRIKIDSNNDGRWTHGNMTLGIEPEEIYFYSETFDVRANWTLENIDISF
ncbi:Ig-like domain-containing domain [Reichenbachiella ulvae]|uniref:Ig-like domain-containing domain n=1 Tax=Reichenbachiella ulvae TaxID=2980104 RepID=A0ABT3CX97_9BACT|nr:Ig-like domain-containing domain [Reichenbachiella ulvae]MCV9388326.1 Ig-like domain-containing domain [Reichenbachiella ulvae]